MKRIALSFVCAAAMFGCCSCGGSGETAFRAEDYSGLPTLRFASYYATEEGESCKLKLSVPYDDSYTVSFSPKFVEKVVLYSQEGERLISAAESFEIELEKGALIYAEIFPAETVVRVEVRAKENLSQLPFDPVNAPDPASFSTDSDPDTDPLTAASVEYVKREGGLYVYSNTPEDLLPEVINHALTREDVSDREVFFTYEHSSNNIKNGCYYGYRVRNTGEGPLYVTVKNIGYQLAGPGSYYGEKEWTDFYNTSFRLPDMSGWTESQKKNFTAYFNFSGKYAVSNFQPATYCIPPGEYLYVIGGTTADAYNGYDVAGTADNKVNGNCQNGAVLFETVGQAEGAFYVYDDPAAVSEDTVSHLGMAGDPESRCYNGTDEGIVVDASATWTFNDKTPSQSLPVTFVNYYDEEAESEGEPHGYIASSPHTQTLTEWWTHGNPQTVRNAVGTDMTTFHTVTTDGREIVVGNDYYDGTGKFSNIGNWMKDYIDTYTFVNSGDRDRTVTVILYAARCGGLAIMARDAEGKLIDGTQMFSLYYIETSYGEEVYEPFVYTAEVPAHSVVQFHVEYNLMANSNGGVSHEVILT